MYCPKLHVSSVCLHLLLYEWLLVINLYAHKSHINVLRVRNEYVKHFKYI
jgi:hypothetical protein